MSVMHACTTILLLLAVLVHYIVTFAISHLHECQNTLCVSSVLKCLKQSESAYTSPNVSEIELAQVIILTGIATAGLAGVGAI